MAKSDTSPIRVLGASLAFMEAIANRSQVQTLETQQLRLLLSLYVHGELNQQDLERYTGVKKTANSRNIARLGIGEKSTSPGFGWITSYDAPDNRRAKLVALTPAGRALLETCAKDVGHLFAGTSASGS